MRFTCIEDTEPLRGDNLLSTTKFQGVPGTHLIDFGGIEVEMTLNPLVLDPGPLN